LKKENRTLRFGDFVVHPRAGELYRRGKKIRVQQQPMQVLVALLESQGGVVTREELRQQIWPADTFVDFEHSLNTAIKKLRQALGDKATKSKFIETLPRRGYRFLPAVTVVEGPAAPRAGKATGLEGAVLSITTEEEAECVLAPVDPKSLEEWTRLTQLGDDVGISILITEKRLLLLAAGLQVRMLSVEASSGWCEVRILEGEHYGKTALVAENALKKNEARKHRSNEAKK
jgi:DNA-binding winged helix-turn-helix (wHTH) protein